MKLWMKLLTVFTVLMLGVSCLASAEQPDTALYNDVTMITDYQDAVGQRASLSVQVTDSGEMFGSIQWSSSAEETRLWLFSLQAAEDGCTYTYSDCVCRDMIGAEQTMDVVTVYENGTGSLTFGDEGVTWQDDQDNAGAQCRFEQVGAVRVEANFEAVDNDCINMSLSAPLEIVSVETEATITLLDSQDVSYIWTLSFMSEGLDYDENSDFTPNVYSNAVCTRYTRNADESWTGEVISENGTGSFELYEQDGYLGYTWMPENDALMTRVDFVPVQVEGPAIPDCSIDSCNDFVIDLSEEEIEQLKAGFDDLLSMLDDLLGVRVLKVENVGTMENTDDTVYCIDAYSCRVDDLSQEHFSVRYDEEHDFARLILANDLVLRYEQGDDLVELNGIEAFNDWFQAKAADGKTQYYLFDLNRFDEVTMLRYLDVD